MKSITETSSKDSASVVWGIEHVIVVYSPSGGAGTTTIATNLAAELATSETRVLLLDCHLQFGQVDAFLNLRTNWSFVDLVELIDELEVELIENMLVTHDSGLRVLTAPAYPDYARDVASSDVIDLIASLASIFDVIVVDAPTRYDDLTCGLFEIAERILLITNPTLPSIRSTRTLLNLLNDLGESAQIADKVTHVFNRVGSAGEPEAGTVPVSSIAKYLKIVDPITISQDERAVLTSINQGEPLVARQRGISLAQEVLQLVKHVRELLRLPVDYTLERVLAPRVESPATNTKPDTNGEPKNSSEARSSTAKTHLADTLSATIATAEKESVPPSERKPYTPRKRESLAEASVGDEKIKVLIADSVSAVRENLRKLLAFESDFEVVGLASTGREAIELAKQLEPDVILMDIGLPDIDGITATKEISEEVQATAVILMSLHSEPSMLRRAMLAGARDFLTKPISSEELYSMLRRVYSQNARFRERMDAFQDPRPSGSVASGPIGDLVRKPITRIEVGEIPDEEEEEQPKLEPRSLFGGKEATSEIVSEDTIQYSAFYPEYVQASQNYILMVFAHLEAVLDEVSRVAAGFEGLMGGKSKRDSVGSITPVSLGSLLTFVPQIEGIVFNPSEQSVTWRPPYQSGNFVFSTPGQLDVDLQGRVLVFQGPLIIGEIPIEMKMLKAHASVTKTIPGRSSFSRFDPVFASYSHKDTPVMEYFRQARENLGQKMLVDIYDLRAGEHWQDRLFEMIDESASFQLFWSENSSNSEYCRKEWEHALKYQDNRPRFIQPVWWKAPMPPPPNELAHLHFQKVSIPLET